MKAATLVLIWLFASTLYLFAHFGVPGEVSFAIPIAQHLKMLGEVKGFDVALLKQMSRCLQFYWLSRLSKILALVQICTVKKQGVLWVWYQLTVRIEPLTEKKVA